MYCVRFFKEKVTYVVKANLYSNMQRLYTWGRKVVTTQ